MRLPSLGSLDAMERHDFITHARVSEAEPGSLIVGMGQTGDAAYFIMSGRAVVGAPQPDGDFHSLATLHEGDFFGEIAALTGSRRTANVVADGPTRLLQVPAAALRHLMANPQFSALVRSTLRDRLAHNHISELPRLAGRNQAALQELRKPVAEVDLKPQTTNHS